MAYIVNPTELVVLFLLVSSVVVFVCFVISAYYSLAVEDYIRC